MKQKQAGFIQGVLLLAIALLGVVIGAIANATSENSVDLATERTKVDAGIVVNTMEQMYERYTLNLSINRDPYTGIDGVVASGMVVSTATKGLGIVTIPLGANAELCASINGILRKSIDTSVNQTDPNGVVTAYGGEGCGKTGASYTYARRFAS